MKDHYIDEVHIEDSLETARALRATSAQINMSLQESARSVEILVEAILLSAGCVSKMQDHIAQMSTKEDMADGLLAISKCCEQAEENLVQSVTALQFYDRLSQRFVHIEENLRTVTEVILAPDLQHSSRWKSINAKLRSVYSFEQEQCIDGSMSVEGPADLYTTLKAGKVEFGSIEIW
jgi:hypothetical protein